MGELHLEVLVDRMKREHKVEAKWARRRSRIRETIPWPRGSGRQVHPPVRRLGQYGHCKIRVEAESWKRVRVRERHYRWFDSAGEYIKLIDQGIREALEGGILAGFPMVDIKVSLYDGSYHDVDSNEMAFKIAGSLAIKEAARKASPVLLEPVMAVEVTVPEEHMGTIIGDINSRRGRIEGMEHSGGSQVIKASVPLKEMFNYTTNMRSSTQGRATYSMHFARYEEAPRSVSDEIIGREPEQGIDLLAKSFQAKLLRSLYSTKFSRSNGRDKGYQWRRKSLTGRSRT